jgi:hypothetical protein
LKSPDRNAIGKKFKVQSLKFKVLSQGSLAF